MKLIPILSLTSLFILFAISASAQTIVLVNGSATKVAVEDNDLTSLYDEVPNYMNGYEADTGGVFQKVSPRLGPQPAAPAVSTAKPTIVEANTNPEIKVNSDYKFNFEGSGSKLSSSNKEVISQFAEKIKSGDAESIQLTCTHKSNNLAGKQSSQARIEAVKAYLQKLGISSNVILTTLVEGGSPDDHGSVSILLKK